MRLLAARALSSCSALIVMISGAAAQASVGVEVSGPARRMVLRYEVPEPQTRIVEIGGEHFSELSLPGEPVTMQPGAPSSSASMSGHPCSIPEGLVS